MPDQSTLRIGIIGAGNIGGTLTRRFTSLGYEVAVANSRDRRRSQSWPLRPAPGPSRLRKPPVAVMSSS